MFFDDIKQLVIQVFKSWEVLSAAAAFIVFAILVDYVSSPNRRQIHLSIPTKLPPKEKKPKPAAPEAGEAADEGGSEE